MIPFDNQFRSRMETVVKTKAPIAADRGFIIFFKTEMNIHYYPYGQQRFESQRIFG